MTATPATLEQLARDTVSIADPETALRALGEVHLLSEPLRDEDDELAVLYKGDRARYVLELLAANFKRNAQDQLTLTAFHRTFD